jgi:hypothetical protein
MDTKSKILFLVLFLAILISVYFTYDRTIVRKDFEITQSEEIIPEEESSVAPDTTEATPTEDTATTTQN